MLTFLCQFLPFRAGYRIEEHLITAGLVIDKTLNIDLPIWIISLDLSKAFDRVVWSALWQALRDHHISDHLIWLMQMLYHGQEGQVVGEWSRSRWFDILVGVRQGCVLSPRLFCSVLEWAMRKWRARVGAA